MATRTGALLAACLLAGASLAAAQKAASSFSDLANLVKSGDTVTVSDSSGASLKGTIDELTATSLVLRVGTEPHRYAESDVARIQQRRQDEVWNGALIGAGVGAIFGALGAGACGLCDSVGAFYAVGIAVGAGVGIGVDTAMVREQIIFDRLGRHGVAMSLAPSIGRGRASAALSFRF